MKDTKKMYMAMLNEKYGDYCRIIVELFWAIYEDGLISFEELDNLIVNKLTL